MATDPQQLLMALAGSTGLGQQIADNAQNQQIQQTLGQQQIQQGQYLQQQQADQASAAQQFQRDVLDYNQDPTPQKLSALAMRYPQQAQNFTAAAKLKDDAQRNADLTSYGQIYAAANNGRSDLVLQQLQQRQQAMRAAGQDTSNIDDAIQQLNAGGDDALKNVKSIALAQIYSHDPDGFTKAFGLDDKPEQNHVIGAGGALVDPSGKVLFQADTKPEYRTVKNADGSESIVQVGGGGGQASTGGGAAGGSGGPARRMGWTPRGPNSDAAVDGKNAGMSKALGIGVDDPFPANASNLDIAKALAISEGGPGSLADRNNNPANLTDPKTGAYRKFPTKEAGLQAAAAQVARNRARGQNSIRTMVEGLPAQVAAGTTAGGSGQVVYNSGGGTAKQVPDDVVGQAYKQYLSPGRANLVQAVIDGRAPAPRPGSKYGEALAEDIARVDPTADATTLPVRQKVRTDFNATGKQGQAMQAYNRFAAHLNSAWALHQQLGGANLGPLSGIAASASQSFSPGLVQKYNTEIEGLQGEFQKLTKLGVANEGEANRLIAAAKPNQSSDGRAGALQGMAELVAGAYQPAVQSWHAAFPGRPLPIDVTPGAKSVINNVLHGGKNPVPVANNGAPQGNATGFGGHGFSHMSKSGKFGWDGKQWVAVH